MRKFTCSVILTIFFHVFVNAQLTFEASPDYGKLWDITYDQTIPNRVYGISLINHIMVSNDNGLTWNIFYSFPSDQAYLSSLKIAPGGKALSFVIKNNPDLQKNALYLLDIDTKAISKTVVPPNWADNPAIASYSIFNAKDSIILLNTSFSINFSPFTKVFYTSDAGANWKEVYYSADNDDVQINNSYISPANGGKLFLTRGLGPTDVDGTLWVSADTGATWVKKLEGKVFDQMAFNPSNPNDIWMGTGIDFVEADEALYHSANGGDNWRQAQNLPLHGIEYGLNNFTHITFDPTNTKTIWITEENEYLKTTDGGVTWASTTFDPNDATYYYGTNLTVNPFNSNQLFITSDGWPQFSNDGGVTLTQAKNPFYNVISLSYGNYKASKHLYYGSQGGYFEKNLATSSTTPYFIESPFIVNGHTRTTIADSSTEGRVFVYTPGDGFVSTSVLAVSNDYGATLTPIPADDYSNQVDRVVKDPANSYTYWASFSSFGSGTLFKMNISRADNYTSTQITTPTYLPIEGINITPAYPDSVFIAEGATIYSTSDGGATWNPKTKGLETFSDDADIIWDMNVNPFNASQFIIATNRGIYMSQDGGNSWGSVLKDVDIRKVNFSPVVNGQIIAATYSAQATECQLYYSNNGGGKWASVPFDKIAYLQSNTISYRFYEDSIAVYFATPDIGIAKYILTGLAGTLPLRLLSFAGTLKNTDALLQWQTAEENLKNYIVERSTDAKTFTGLTSIAAENSNGTHNYDYTDKQFMTVSGKGDIPVYYRLKMTDVDGKLSYSNTIKLHYANGMVTGISVYPNPVVNTLNLHLNSITGGNYTVSITGVTGKQLYGSNYKLAQGESVISIPVSNLSAGVYVIAIKDINGKTNVIKFVK